MKCGIEISKGKQFRIGVVQSVQLQYPGIIRYQINPYLKKAGYENVELNIIEKSKCHSQMKQVMNKNYDLIFNLCEGCATEQRSGLDVCNILNTIFQVPFVGPSIKGFEPTRQEMKRACLTNGIFTPKYVFIYDLNKDMKLLDQLTFPMIVKHYNSAGSWDMTRQSKVTNKQQLQIQVGRMVQRNQGALVEQFIEGREFTCLVAENAEDLANPIVYQPIQFKFTLQGDTFKYADLKFDSTKYGLKALQIQDKTLSQNIKDSCVAFFKVFQTQSYARCDLRMNNTDKLFMLEINAMPALFYPQGHYSSADEILLKAPGGHTAFLENIMKVAVVRHQMKQQPWRIQHNNNTGYLIKSLQAIKRDEIVYDIKSRPLKVKSISDLAKCTNFIGEVLIQKRFYISIEPQLVITSENELDNYKFFQHSDDPNCWLEELRIIARKDIFPNEELSFDFSTLYGDDWSNLCNPSHSKSNWKEIQSKYQGHVSTFIKRMARKT